MFTPASDGLFWERNDVNLAKVIIKEVLKPSLRLINLRKGVNNLFKEPKMKNELTILLCLFPIILLSLTCEFDKIDEFAASGDYGEFHRLLIEDDYLYAISHYGFEINAVDENGELNKISLIPIEGDVDGIEKIGSNVFVSVSTSVTYQSEIHSALYKIDISNPYEPFVADSIVFPEDIKNYILRNYGNYLAYHKLEEINNSWFYTQLVFMDPITFEEVTSFVIQTWTEPLRDNYFLRQRNPGEYIFDVYDYTDIFDIQVISSVNFELCPTAFLKMYAIDDSTLVLLGNESISFYDFSDISNIELLSTHYRQSTSSPFGDCIRIDDFILIPSQCDGIEIVDITDIENPFMFDFWEYPIEELTQVNPYFVTSGALIYDNDHLYVGTFYNGVLLMNYNNGTIEYVNKFINNRINTSIHKIYNNQIITTGYSGGLYVYNIEEVNSPTLNMIVFEDLFMIDFKIINNYIYLTTYSNPDENSYFKVFDISNLSNPILQFDILLNGISSFLINENELDYIYICSSVNIQSYEISKYDISDPENIEQILLFEFTEIVQPFFFYEGYLYIQKSNDSGMKDLLIYDGFEEENPELVSQIINFTNSPRIFKINDYLNISQSSNSGGDLFYSLDDPINPEFIFSTQNTSKWSGCKLKNNVLFSPSEFTVYLYDLEGNPSGELEPFDHFNLNSRYNNITFYSQGDEDYFFCEQLECISTYNYSIETSAHDELLIPELTLSNYPNPFNPITSIVFNLPEEGEVQLDIYNIKGQKVKQLVSDSAYQLSAGQHSVVWDGKDENNKTVSSGIYMYQLKVNGEAIASKKCLLLK